MAAVISGPQDLPPELFELFLVEAIQARGIKRAMRLRLVSSLFADKVIQVIYRFRMLESCPIRLGVLGTFGSNYLAHRVLNTRLPVAPRLANIRYVADKLAKADNNNRAHYAVYVRLLCAKVIETPGRLAMSYSMAHACRKTNLMDDNWSPDFKDLDLLSAATYFKHIAVVKNLLIHLDRTFVSEVTTSNLDLHTFGHPLYNAALEWDVETVELLQLWSTFDVPSVPCYRDFEPWCLTSLCANGAPLRIIMKVFPFIDHDIRDKYGLPISAASPERIYCSPSAVDHVVSRCMETPHVEVFDHLASIWWKTTAWRCADMNAEFSALVPDILLSACRRGYEDMVRHLLSIGASVNGMMEIEGEHISYWQALARAQVPMLEACSGGHEAIVRILVEHGAQFLGNEVALAASKRHWGLVRTLLDYYGFDINSGPTPAIVSAVSQEEDAIFRGLLDRGASLDGYIGFKAVRAARDVHSESMLDLLKEHGVDVDAGPEGKYNGSVNTPRLFSFTLP